MHKPLVFISHSSRYRSEPELGPGDTVAAQRQRKKYIRAVIAELADELERRRIAVWWDNKVIDPADDYRPKIAMGLERCDAAVLLVDADALSSGFMIEEATVLANRSYAHESFRVLPVLLGGVTAPEFEKSGLGTSGAIAQRASAIVIEDDDLVSLAAEHARTIADSLGLEPVEDPIESAWVETMEVILRSLDEELQDRAAEALGVSEDEWAGVRRKPNVLARALFAATLETGVQVYREVSEFLETPKRKSMGRRLRPLWVNISLSRHVLSAAMGSPSKSTALGTGSLKLAGHAVQRASADQAGLAVYQLKEVAGEDAEDELVQRFALTLLARLNLSPEDTPEEIAEWLRATNTVPFALLAMEEIPARVTFGVVERLIRLFPGVLFVLVAPIDTRLWEKMRGSKQILTKSREQERDILRHVGMIEQRMYRDEP